MSNLKYLPERIKDPKNHPRRAYFCCHREDLSLISLICQDIWQFYPDCVIAHRDHTQAAPYSAEPDIVDVQLFIVPVTEKLLEEKDGAFDIEFRFAQKQGVPILPILFDGSTQQEFNRRTGNRQLLCREDPEYPEKLQRCLMAALVADETERQVRDIFSKRMFISYCHEDRQQVLSLIRRIHETDAHRRIAIWFDKYLAPGKNFEESIFESMDLCNIFAMTLTPNLLSREGYVKEKEYPYAEEHNKKIILFEMEQTDRAALRGMFPTAENHALIPDSETQAFAQALEHELKGLDIPEKVYPKRDLCYLLGMAYFSGIGVEFDRDYALKMLAAAAAGGSLAAMDQLSRMYAEGIGVERSAAAAIKWRKKAAEQTYSRFKAAFQDARSYMGYDAIQSSALRGDTDFPLLESKLEALSDSLGAYLEQQQICIHLLRDEGSKEVESRYRTIIKAVKEVQQALPVTRLADFWLPRIIAEREEWRLVMGAQSEPIDPYLQIAIKWHEEIKQTDENAHTAAYCSYVCALQKLRQNGDTASALELLLNAQALILPYKETRACAGLLLKIRKQLASLYSHLGADEAAFFLYRQLLGDSDNITRFSEEGIYSFFKAAEFRRHLGDLHRKRGELAAAAQCCKEAIETLRSGEQQPYAALPGDFQICLLEAYAQVYASAAAASPQDTALQEEAAALYHRFAETSFGEMFAQKASRYLHSLKQTAALP